jgi:hypothetical protein
MPSFDESTKEGDLIKSRLTQFFGSRGAALILRHFDKLEETFGTAAVVIRNVMEGKTSAISATKITNQAFNMLADENFRQTG